MKVNMSIPHASYTPYTHNARIASMDKYPDENIDPRTYKKATRSRYDEVRRPGCCLLLGKFEKDEKTKRMIRYKRHFSLQARTRTRSAQCLRSRKNYSTKCMFATLLNERFYLMSGTVVTVL